MLKILFINRGMGMFRGGGEQFDLNISKELLNLDCEINFLVGKPLIGNLKFPVNRTEVRYIASPYLRDLSQKLEMYPFPVKQISYRLYNMDQWLFGRSVINFLKKNSNYDIVQICGLLYLGSEIFKKFNIPAVVRLPGPPYIKDIEYLENCSGIIANGDAILKTKSMTNKQIHDIPPGIDHTLFRKVDNSIRQKYSIQYDEKLLIFVGRLVPLKNMSFLIKSFYELIKTRNKVKLMIVGEGPLEEESRRLSDSLGLKNKIIFAGRVSNRELPGYYSASDAFVLSSMYENFPNSMIEAMSCELPVVATNVGGIPLLVKDGINGFLSENGNTQQFNKNIIELLENKDLSIKIGEANRKKALKEFNWRESASKLKNVYTSLL